MEKVRSILEDNPILRDKLFCRGFYFTNAEIVTGEYPFYDNWDLIHTDGFSLAVHKKQHFYISKEQDTTLLLIGHAYDPIDRMPDEQDILSCLNRLLGKDKEQFWDKFNNLTGIFTLIAIREHRVYLVGDPTGMQTTFYSKQGDKIYISSHTNLLGDLLGCRWAPYVKELVSYRFFSLLGNSLPGDITQFRSVRRLVPNHYICFDPMGKIRIRRFFTPYEMEGTLEELACRAADILHANMELIAKKWRRPAISLTGGCDSKTTLACTNGLYDRFSYFSYESSEPERVDAEAARDICDTLGIDHTIYMIPDDNEGYSNLSEIDEILFWNSGGIKRSHANDVRKRAFFADTKDFDVEVKSWASEVGRAYYSKRFHGRTNFGDRPTPRRCTTLYKFFLHNRKLVRQTDAVFAGYLERFFRQDRKHPIPWQEQFFWEFRVPSWNGLVITGEHRYSYDITIPYNNRKLLTILLGASIEERIEDVLYKKIRDDRNPEIDATGVSVTNLLHTEKREIMENLYYTLHSEIPF